MSEIMINAQKACCFLTRKCNVRCRACNVINHPTETELSTQEWKDTFSEIKKYVNFTVLFGGEPTLRNDLPDIVEHLNNIKLPHTIITNAYRMLNDNEFYERLLLAEPFGFSVSINKISEFNKTFADEDKGDKGLQLIQKLRNSNYNGDITANMGITHQNIKDLPAIVEEFTRQSIWTIMTPFHVCKPKEQSFWWYRGHTQGLSLTKEDMPDVINTSKYFIDNYDKLLLHNSKQYFKAWPEYATKRNWLCNAGIYTLQIDADGSIMMCVDRPLPQRFSVFDLSNRSKCNELQLCLNDVVSSCPGCFWDHLYETNMYASQGRVDYAKNFFTHNK